MNINEKINNRAVNSRVEKYKGKKGMAFSIGVYGKTRERVIKNGGSNLPALLLTHNTGVKEKLRNALPLHCKWFTK